MILLALVLGSTLTYAQRGYNSGARPGNGHHNGYHQQSNRGNVGVNHGNRGGNGYYRSGRTQTQTRYYRGNGYGTTYRGGVRTYDARPVTRVRWRTSNCGTYRIKMTQERRWVDGYWTYRNGCRRWVEPTYSWHTICRERVYPTSCGW